MTDTYTYDLETDIGKVRLYSRNKDLTNTSFSDEEIQVYLDDTGDVKLAAAQVLDEMASDQSIILKITSTLGTSVNGVAVAQDLRNRANKLREQVEDETTFDVADTDFASLP